MITPAFMPFSTGLCGGEVVLCVEKRNIFEKFENFSGQVLKNRLICGIIKDMNGFAELKKGRGKAHG